MRPASGAPLIYGLSFTNQTGRASREYRKFAGPGIPDKGDANDLLCHHFPDISAARAALDALPKFSPRIQRRPVRTTIQRKLTTTSPAGTLSKKPSALPWALTASKLMATAKIFPAPIRYTRTRTPSAAWHKGGYCTCHGCGDTYNAKQVAEWLGIDWRALIRPQRSFVSAGNIDLDAAPQIDSTEAPLSFDQAARFLAETASTSSINQLKRSYFSISLTCAHRAGPLAEQLYHTGIH